MRFFPRKLTPVAAWKIVRFGPICYAIPMTVDMDFKSAQMLAYRAMGCVTTEEITHWAMHMLETGYDTESLGILAGMSKWDSLFEAEQYLKTAFKELGWQIPEEQVVVRAYAINIALAILDGTTAPSEGSRELVKLGDYYLWPAYLDEWCWISEELDPETHHPIDDFNATVRNAARKLSATTSPTDSR